MAAAKLSGSLCPRRIDGGKKVTAEIDCGAELALAHHHGTFQLTEEPIDAPRAALAEVLAAAGIHAERFRVLQPGQVWEL